LVQAPISSYELYEQFIYPKPIQEQQLDDRAQGGLECEQCNKVKQAIFVCKVSRLLRSSEAQDIDQSTDAKVALKHIRQPSKAKVGSHAPR